MDRQPIPGRARRHFPVRWNVAYAPTAEHCEACFVRRTSIFRVILSGTSRQLVDVQALSDVAVMLTVRSPLGGEPICEILHRQLRWRHQHSMITQKARPTSPFVAPKISETAHRPRAEKEQN
jgi:hypothetical protein